MKSASMHAGRIFEPKATPLQQVAEASFPTRWGDFRILGFEMGEDTAVVLRRGSPEECSGRVPLVRIHSQCLTGDVFGSLRCDCRDQLELSLERISKDGCGLLIYEDKEGRGIGLMNKLQAYALQDAGADTVEANERLGFGADQRDYALPVAILRHLDIRRVRFLSNNPAKLTALQAAGIEVVERVPCEPRPSSRHAREYLNVKRAKLGHLLTESSD
jgi:GTP cyclohydrolase II